MVLRLVSISMCECSHQNRRECDSTSLAIRRASGRSGLRSPPSFSRMVYRLFSKKTLLRSKIWHHKLDRRTLQREEGSIMMSGSSRASIGPLGWSTTSRAISSTKTPHLHRLFQMTALSGRVFDKRFFADNRSVSAWPRPRCLSAIVKALCQHIGQTFKSACFGPVQSSQVADAHTRF